MDGKTLRKYAIDLVLNGVTTVSEAMRISNQIDE
jgi:type II secretory ATPase GspE/PulE/Tfp pilus assembly ATPase PilB-like protein